MRCVLSSLIVVTIVSGCSAPATLPLAPGPATQTAPPAPTNTPEAVIRVLFLGNSYTYGNDLPELFAELARSGGHNVEVDMLAEGGLRLSDHAQSMETLDRLTSSQWTFVVLQEQSQIPALQVYRRREMYPAARQLVSNVRQRGATPLFFLTWAHRDGWPEQGMDDFESMQKRITEGYTEIAQELDVPVAPVGSAWLTAVEEYPELNLWREDGNHPRKQGSYLAACVFYAAIFQENPVGLDYRADIAAETAQMLQTIAAKTVLNRP